MVLEKLVDLGNEEGALRALSFKVVGIGDLTRGFFVVAIEVEDEGVLIVLVVVSPRELAGDLTWPAMGFSGVFRSRGPGDDLGVLLPCGVLVLPLLLSERFEGLVVAMSLLIN